MAPTRSTRVRGTAVAFFLLCLFFGLQSRPGELDQVGFAAVSANQQATKKQSKKARRKKKKKKKQENSDRLDAIKNEENKRRELERLAAEKEEKEREKKQRKEREEMLDSLATAGPSQLLDILDRVMHFPLFNIRRASEAYRRLSTFSRRGQLDQSYWNSSQLRQLHSQAQAMVKAKAAQQPNALANIWVSLAHLSKHVSLPLLLAGLVQSGPIWIKHLDAQRLSSSLWALLTLKDADPVVLQVVPDIVAQITDKAGMMAPQQLNDCLWNVGRLKDVAPAVLQIVPAITDQICQEAEDMTPQLLSSCLAATGQLQVFEPEVLRMVGVISAEIKKPHNARALLPQHLGSCLHAAVLLEDAAPEVLKIIPAIVAQITSKARDMSPSELVSCLWKAWQLRDIPAVLEIVPAVAMQIRQDAELLTPREWSSCIQVTLKLKDLVPEILRLVPAFAEAPKTVMKGLAPRKALELQKDFLRFSAKSFNPLVPKLRTKNFDTAVNLVWSCASARVTLATCYLRWPFALCLPVRSPA